ncbi:MAG: NAD(+)/NADH kinase [Bacteroidales bacterium]|nr:NAD(+)/NADH kinase [Bacteroidales bacterium]MDY2916881.1 NAD(+)/NADH kinase [Muribaculaceae bacterium]
MRIAIYGSRRQLPYKDSIQSLLRRLSLAGAEIYMAHKLYTHLAGDLALNLSAVTLAGSDFRSLPHIDMALSIGGDGTFLRTAAWVADTGTPILGINTGHLGYLAPLPVADAPAFVDNILAGNYTVEHRSLLQVTEPATRGWHCALNEVVLAKDDSASLITAETLLDSRPLATYKADGLIIATPTGSTAYNLSAGGPIIQPTAPVWVLSPIAAHSLGMRPLVVSDDTVLRITVSGRGHTFRLTLDGRSTTLPMGTQVTVRRAPFTTGVVQPLGTGFPAVLRTKLMFNA